MEALRHKFQSYIEGTCYFVGDELKMQDVLFDVQDEMQSVWKRKGWRTSHVVPKLGVASPHHVFPATIMIAKCSLDLATFSVEFVCKVKTSVPPPTLALQESVPSKPSYHSRTSVDLPK